MINSDHKYLGIVTIDDAIELQKKSVKSVDDIIRDDAGTTSPETPVKRLLSDVLTSSYPVAILDEDGRLSGIVDRASIISEVNLNDPEYSSENGTTQETEPKQPA